MGMISILEVKPGMIVESVVTDSRGTALLGAGAEITAKHIKVFKMWGVREISVQGKDHEEMMAEQVSGIEPERMARAEERCRSLFAHCDMKGAATRELFGLAVLRMAKMAGEESDNAV